MERKRLLADRFRRIWQIIEDIAREPGKSRKELAAKFALSERQVQADLNVIRTDIRLPLVRRQGYRFEDSPPGDDHRFNLAEAQILLVLLRHAQKDRSIPPESLREFVRKLPHAFPPHLKPLVEKTLDVVDLEPRGRQQQIFAALADAMLRRVPVKLHYPPGDSSTPVQDPEVLPDLLLPYLDSWFLVGRCRQKSRVMMFDLASVVAVTLGSELQQDGDPHCRPPASSRSASSRSVQ